MSLNVLKFNLRPYAHNHGANGGTDVQGRNDGHGANRLDNHGDRVHGDDGHGLMFLAVGTWTPT